MYLPWHGQYYKLPPFTLNSDISISSKLHSLHSSAYSDSFSTALPQLTVLIILPNSSQTALQFISTSKTYTLQTMHYTLGPAMSAGPTTFELLPSFITPTFIFSLIFIAVGYVLIKNALDMMRERAAVATQSMMLNDDEKRTLATAMGAATH
ncbi:hypothetical protein FPQ18DRAFT_387214 [Pyronema domesticum]|uniref:Uncharacterized protein n=1 Tax=Pyronema omphalodes (strain CBS 100304) TaxID=1076935 RepID=U4KYQ7_PYROM|nr:hypothetical protein FPQ18DRAFT_387214 [Pyronema domesticum]CCX06795.1 Protein of unknown function [Pyronema omphalodes CBS 100304]